ncbi:MAG: methyl-accepting chemotaxis protein [Desulfobacteraceae bacterium]|jgi:methyl-accepting chemotaxis protein
MLKKLTVKGRMYLINFAVLLQFVTMAWFAWDGAHDAMRMGIDETSGIMLEDQRAKVQVASHTIALAAGHAIEGIGDRQKQIDIIRQLIDDIRFEEDESGYYFVYENTTVIALPPKKSLEGKDLKDAKDKNDNYFIRELNRVAHEGGGFYRWTFPKPNAGDQPKLGYAEMIPGTNFWIGTGVYLDNINAAQVDMAGKIGNKVDANTTRMLIISGLIFAGIIALCLAIAFGIVTSLKEMIAGFRDVAEGEGDLTKRIQIISKDEIGELAVWFNTFLQKLQKILKNLAENAQKIDQSSHTLTAIAGQMSKGTDETSVRADSVATAAEEMSSNLNSVAAAMEESSTNASMVASAAEEMNATINDISRNAEKAHTISDQAVTKTEEASKQMDELGQAAHAIGKVVETITEISEQVNLLALNATIEAARAGDAGKGFAVVANEIKALARQTADATLDIKEKISNIQTSTDGTVERISQIRQVISNVNEIVASIATAVDEQSAATKEIASNITQASSGIQEVNENVNQSSNVASQITQDITTVNQSANDMSKSSSQIKMNAEELKHMASELNTLVGSFKV